MAKLTKEQIAKLISDPKIQETVEKNKKLAVNNRDRKLMLLGYNQALLDNGGLPDEGLTVEALERIIANSKLELSIE